MFRRKDIDKSRNVVIPYIVSFFGLREEEERLRQGVVKRMAKRDKLLAKAKGSPQNMSFQELETLAAAYGLPLKPGGSHYVQRLPDGTKNTIKREGDKVNKLYVQDVVEAIETFGLTQEKEVKNGEENKGEKGD